MEDFLGFITLLSGPVCPKNYKVCDGALLSIEAYPDLFRVIGKMYGGDGTTTFALPDFMGRTPVGYSYNGPNPKFPQLLIGAAVKGGENNITLKDTDVETHTHPDCSIKAYIELRSDSDSPKNHVLGVPWAKDPSGEAIRFQTYTNSPDPGDTVSMNSGALTIDYTGGTAHENMMPYLGLKFVICVKGIYPPRQN